MSSLMQLWIRVLDELGTQIGICTTRDRKYVSRRVEHEGLSFLTITLSDFGKDFEKSLDQGYIAPDSFKGFPRTGKFPSLFKGFLELVFDCEYGWLLENPEIDAIFAIRQLTLMNSKVQIPCSDARVDGAINGYLETEEELKRQDALSDQYTESRIQRFGRVSRLLLANALSSVDLRVYRGELMPKHGPGATADRLSGNRKYRQTEWTTRLEQYFPALEFITPGWKYDYLLNHVEFLTPEQERPVRVITVPKTLKTPRIIAIEPTCMQYTQQALLEVMLEELQRDDLLKEFLGFDDQSPNQEMARKGSIEGNLATLDLSEASDRVSNQHVLGLLANYPHLRGAVQACRSRKADVPGHGVIRLSKFASMGSALTFPMEAMVFLAVVFSGIERERRRPLTRKDLKAFVGRVRIYGDDIIIPVEYVSAVILELEAFGFKVNEGKSFWTGKFRESCGKEYYDGSDVSIAKVRQVLPVSRARVVEIIATVSLRNQLYKLGLWETCQWLDQLIEPLLNGRYPQVAETSAVLGRVSFLGYETQRMHPYLHSPLVRGYRVRARLPKSKLADEYALLKCLLKRGEEPFEKGHLERAGRAEFVDLKLGWYSPF